MTGDPMATLNPDVDWDTIHLGRGRHNDREHGTCLLEAVAWIAGEDHSDHPECVSPVLAAFGRTWNDNLDDDDRQRLLKPIGPRLVGTRASAEVEDRRAWLALDWLVRVYTPAWLALAGLDEHAAALRAASPVVDAESLEAVMGVLREGRDAAVAAWDAAWDAAGAAAWAARDARAARAAAGDAARAARDAAGAAARAARAAAGDAAWEAARAARDAARAARDAARAARAAAGAAARAAAWDAAGAAARAAAWDAAGAAARAAAWDALRSTVVDLQTSALDLYERMIEAA